MDSESLAKDELKRIMATHADKVQQAMETRSKQGWFVGQLAKACMEKNIRVPSMRLMDFVSAAFSKDPHK